MDRQYFTSIYFASPRCVVRSGDDAPRFRDRRAAGHLGEALKLPPAAEANRAAIEASLPPIIVGR